MKVLIGRELRALIPTTVVGMIVLAAFAVAFQAFVTISGFTNSVILWPDALWDWVGPCGSALAIVIALVQTRLDQKPELWPFLLHRPISQSRIFASKAIAGVIAYMSAVAIPLFGQLYWASVPGHVPAPFHWRMAVPGTIDMVLGVVWYFATFLMALRPASWYGSRFLPAIAVMGVASLVVFNPSAPEGLRVAFEWVAIAGLAAWGCILGFGETERAPRMGRFCLATILLAGIVVIFSAVTLLSSTSENMSRGMRISRTISSGKKLTMGLSDLARGNISQGDRFGISHPFEETDFRTSTDLNKADYAGAFGYHLAQHYAVDVSGAVFGPQFGHEWKGDTWAPLLDRSEQVVKCYRHGTNRLAWYFDATGFHDEPIAKRFAPLHMDAQYWPPMPILVGRSKAMYFEPANRKAFPILTVWMPEFIISVTSLADTTSNAATTIFAVRTNRRMVVVDNKGRTVLQLPLTPVLKGPQSATLSVNVLPANTGFCFWLQDQGSSALTAIQFDNKGHEMQQQTFRRVVHNTHDNASQARSVFYSPALLACRAAGIKLDEFGTGRGSRGTRVALPSALLSGLISALLLLPIALRLRWSRTATAAWAAGCFAIGPALVLTVLALYGWPALVPCASCGRKRIVTRDLCEHCGAAWPEAAPDATEIFESDGIL